MLLPHQYIKIFAFLRLLFSLFVSMGIFQKLSSPREQQRTSVGDTSRVLSKSVMRKRINVNCIRNWLQHTRSSCRHCCCFECIDFIANVLSHNKYPKHCLVFRCCVGFLESLMRKEVAVTSSLVSLTLMYVVPFFQWWTKSSFIISFFQFSLCWSMLKVAVLISSSALAFLFSHPWVWWENSLRSPLLSLLTSVVIPRICPSRMV